MIRSARRPGLGACPGHGIGHCDDPDRLPGARALRLGAILALAVAAGTTACAGRRTAETALRPTQEVYELALRKMEKKRYFSARNLLQEALPRIPPDDRELLPRVQLAIADAFYLDKGILNYGEALNAFRNFLTYFPEHPRADHAQFMVGMSLFQQALSPDRDQATTLRAIDEFRKVESVYPDSSYATRARQQIQACLDRLAEHERLIGRFYQRRDAWQAAVDRYRYVLEHYPRFSGTSQVLFDLGRTLLDAGNHADAGEAFARLLHDFPDDRLAGKARALMREAERKGRSGARTAQNDAR